MLPYAAFIVGLGLMIMWPIPLRRKRCVDPTLCYDR
jgi:hypothetical protein